MGILDKVFGKKPENGATFSDDILGTLTWNANDNAWEGKCGEIPISLDYERNQVQPSNGLIEYAQSFMKDISFLDESLAKEINSFIEKVPEIKNIPEKMNEIKSLRYEEIFFSLKQKDGYVFGTLGPENNERCWRIEFLGTKSIGLGFDT